MNKRNDARGYVHERARGLERIPTVNLGSRSGFIGAPLVQPAIKSRRLRRYAPNVFDLQLKTSASPYILDKENRDAVYEVFTQSQNSRAAHKAKSI